MSEQDFPALAGVLLFITGGLAVVLAIGLVLFPLPRYVGIEVSIRYRYLLAVLAFIGGGLHLLAGRWSSERRYLFGTVAATLVGMVLLQVSVPIDLVIIALLVLGRNDFEDR